MARAKKSSAPESIGPVSTAPVVDTGTNPGFENLILQGNIFIGTHSVVLSSTPEINPSLGMLYYLYDALATTYADLLPT